MPPSGRRTAISSASGGRRTPVLIVVGLVIVLIAALVGIDLLVLSRNNPERALSPHYYMALGNSLSFGYQPDFDFTSGFVDDIFHDLRPASVTGVVNYACAGETTDTMIDGGCVGGIAHHGSYTGSQLQAAINFLKETRNQGRVSPITLEIGSNDVFPDWNQSTCTAGPNVDADLARMDSNLTQVILPRLLDCPGSGTERRQRRPAHAELLQSICQRMPGIRPVRTHVERSSSGRRGAVPYLGSRRVYGFRRRCGDGRPYLRLHVDM